MEVRDGPAAVRGDALRRKPLGRDAGKAAEGEPRVRRPAGRPPPSEPLAEGGFVAQAARLLSHVLALVLPAIASAATVQVRVEGKTRTLFGPHRSHRDRDDRRSTHSSRRRSLGEFYYHVTAPSFGPYVDQIGRYGGAARQRLGVQGRQRLAARRRRPGHAEGRRHGALVLRRRSVRPAARRRCSSSAVDERLLHGRRVRRQRQGGGRRPASSGTSARRRRCRRRPARASARAAASGLLVRATATGAVRSNALK